MSKKILTVIAFLIVSLLATGILTYGAPSVSHYKKVRMDISGLHATKIVDVDNYATGRNVSFMNDIVLKADLNYPVNSSPPNYDGITVDFDQIIDPQYSHDGVFKNQVTMKGEVVKLVNTAQESKRGSYPTDKRQVSFLQFVHRNDLLETPVRYAYDATTMQIFSGMDVGSVNNIYIKQVAKNNTLASGVGEPDCLNAWDALAVKRLRKGNNLPSTISRSQSGYMNSASIGSNQTNGGVANLSQTTWMKGDQTYTGTFSNIAASGSPVTTTYTSAWVKTSENIHLDW